MTEEQLIEELLLEASALGIKDEVLDASEKYLDQGLERLEALEQAYNELTEDWDTDDWDTAELYDDDDLEWDYGDTDNDDEDEN